VAPVKNEMGKKYGMLTVVSSGPMHRNLRHWVCVCECGKTTKPISGASLRDGNTRSCGCLKKVNSGQRKHGMTGHSALESYKGAKARCTNPGNLSYPYYGARGVEFRLPPFEEFWSVLGSSWFPGAHWSVRITTVTMNLETLGGQPAPNSA
jgi:hypothetical protein